MVAARPEGAPKNVRGLSLYLVPRRGEDGQLNYRIRRLKDKIATRSVPTGEIEFRHSEGWLLGQAEQGIYLILEVLNLCASGQQRRQRSACTKGYRRCLFFR